MTARWMMTSGFDDVLPAGFALVRRWLSPVEADGLLASLRERVEWQQHSGSLFGRPYLTPRQVCWFGETAYAYSGVEHPARPLLPEIAALGERAAGVSGTVFNGCLANRYRDGADSVGWHADDELCIDPSAAIASVSVGAARDFRIRERASGRTWTVPLGHGDLLVMGAGTQASFVHQVPRRARAGERINLTLRRHLSARGRS